MLRVAADQRAAVGAIPDCGPLVRSYPRFTLCLHSPPMNHENLQQSIDDLAARMVNIRDSL